MTYPVIPDGVAPRVHTPRGEAQRLRQQIAESTSHGTPPKPVAYGGEWRSTSAATITTSTHLLFNLWDTVVETPNGISHSNGIFTVTQPGLWVVDTGSRATGITALYWYLSPAGNPNMKWRSASTAGDVCVSYTHRFAAGDTFGVCYWVSGTAPKWDAVDAGGPNNVPGISAHLVSQ